MAKNTVAKEQWKYNALKWRGLRVIEGGRRPDRPTVRPDAASFELVKNGGAGGEDVRIAGARLGARFHSPVCVFWEFFEFQKLSREVFCVVYLDSAGFLVWSEVGLGGLRPYGTFLKALRGGARAVLVVHSRPSGNPEPNGADLRLQERLVRGGQRNGIRFDHVIIGWRRFFSFDLGQVVTVG